MKPKQIKELVLKLTDGLLMTVTDLILLQIFLLGSSWGKIKTSRSAYAAFEEAEREFEMVNYLTIKQSLGYLKRQGLIKSMLEPLITAQGRKRLTSKVPQYLPRRTWDKVIYLITYDIPEKKRRFRDRLREILTKAGAACLQASVWLTPYNPRKILEEFSEKPGFEGEIIISCIGKDGYIGQEDIKSLVSRVYHLEAINRNYEEFLEKFGDKNKAKINKWHTAVSYLLILKEDPQLPFELLPDSWAGEEAHRRYCRLTKLVN